MSRHKGRSDLCGASSPRSYWLVEVSMAGVMCSRALIAYRETDSCVSSMTLVDDDFWMTEEEEVTVFWTTRADLPLGGRPTAALSSLSVGAGATLLVCLERAVRALFVKEE